MANTTGKVLAGLLTGMAVGAVIGLLVAPDKGSNTRKKISESLKGLGNKLEDEISEIADQAEKMKEDVKHYGKDLGKQLARS